MFSAARPFLISMATARCALLLILTSAASVAADPTNVMPLLSIDARGLHTGRNHLEATAVGVALISALLVASSRDGNWCNGPGCEAGVGALFVAAPLLDAAARDERDP